MYSEAFGQSPTKAPPPSLPIQKSLPRAWGRWESWPELRETRFQDSSRFYFSLQVFAERRALLAAAGTAVARNSTIRKEIVVFRDSGSQVLLPLPVDDPQLPKPVSDGCGAVVVFWLVASQKVQEIWFARLKADHWSAPKRIPGLYRPFWGANQNSPFRLPGCRVALAVVARDTTTGETQHRLVIVADSAITHIRPIASDGSFQQSDIAQQGRMLTYAYMRPIPESRDAITYLRSIDEGKTWKLVRNDTLPRNTIAQSTHLITVGRDLWFGRVEGQSFAAKGERRLVIGPLTQRTTYSTTFVDDGWSNDYFMTGSACNAPTLVRLTGGPIKRIVLHAFDGALWHELEGPQSTVDFAATSRSPPGRSVDGMAVVVDTTNGPPHMKFFRVVDSCNR